jgi:phage terminase small subunit
MKNPAGLSREAKCWLDAVAADFVFERHETELLVAAAEAWDRCRLAREAIARDGMTVIDRFDQVKPHPLLNVERDARAAVVSGLRALKFEPAQSGDLHVIPDRQRRVRRQGSA